MPSGSGDGIVSSLTFTPDAAGTVIVTATYDCKGTDGSDWGSSFVSKLFRTQSASTVYSDALGMSTTRQSQTARAVFTVTAGSSVEVGLYGDISGAVAASWWNIALTAELVKR